MPTDTFVLDYAALRLRGELITTAAAWFGRTSLAACRWCLRNHHHLFGLAGAVVAAATVSAALDARVILSTPVFGGCGAARSFAYAKLHMSGMALWSLPVLWLVSLRSAWASRVARTATLIAVVWWLYMRYPMHGPRFLLHS